MEIINLTPQPIRVFKNDGVILDIPSMGFAKPLFLEKEVGEVDGIPIVELFSGKVNLPDPQDNVFYIVYHTVAEIAAANDRITADLLIPVNTVREPNNPFVYCQVFARLPQ